MYGSGSITEPFASAATVIVMERLGSIGGSSVSAFYNLANSILKPDNGFGSYYCSECTK
jgi:hypothetical protein